MPKKNNDRQPSMTVGQLRVAVIGAQTAQGERDKPHTVYRTVVTYQHECYERLLRYSDFYALHKKLKLRDAKQFHAKFPGKTWSRKASFHDDVIEARQVLLNEYMKNVCRNELTPESETYLMKVLRIGKYEDGNGRVSEISSYKPSIIEKSERSGLPVVKEDEDLETDAAKPNVSTTLPREPNSLRNVTSNATTVMTEDERSAVSSQASLASDEGDHARGMKIEESTSSKTSLSSGRSTSLGVTPPSSTGARLKPTQSMPAAPMQGSMLPTSNSSRLSSTAVRAPPSDADVSAEKTYQARISTQLSVISQLLSESEVDPSLEAELNDSHHVKLAA